MEGRAFLTIYDYGGLIGIVSSIISVQTYYPILDSLHINFEFNLQVLSEKN